MPFWFDHFLDSRTEIHQNFVLFFLENLRHQKVILKLTDLYNRVKTSIGQAGHFQLQEFFEMISALKTMWRWKWKKWRSLRSFVLELIDLQREIVSTKLLQRNSMMPSQTSKMTIACIVPCFMVSKESSLESNSNVLTGCLNAKPDVLNTY